MLKQATRMFTLAGGAILSCVLLSGTARAVPSFAAQTGQPCASCHIGGYGPQLTAFGRAFKIGGYTQAGGEGILSQIPLSVMALGSFTHTSSDLPQGSIPHHYDANNNPALDQVSLFIAGRLGEHSGGFIQGTYSNVNNVVHLDSLDLRPYTTTVDVGGNELRLGTTINNAPTITDPYNSTYAWGFPYNTSSVAPLPTAQPILVSGLAGNSTGVTAYAWYDHSLYFEAGGYQTQSPWLLSRLGNSYGVGQSQGVAPYLRAAYEWNWNGQSAHIGALFLQANAFPLASARLADRSNGSNGFTDFAVDGGYEFFGDGTHTVTTQGIYVHEQQDLKASAAAGNAANGTALGSSYGLNQIRLTTAYWYQNTYGAQIGWQKTWGAANPLLNGPLPVYGSANSKPNSNAFIMEADWVPFGKDGSWGSPWANLKLGLQYTVYTQFNGASRNYDGYGRNASGNNTLYLLSWLVF